MNQIIRDFESTPRHWYRHADGRIEPMAFEEMLRFCREHGEPKYRQHDRIAETLFATPDAAHDPRNEGIRVSTVFLYLDHAMSFTPNHVPILYETMIFGFPEGHPLDQYTDRYATEDEARKGHDEIVALVRMALDPATAAELEAVKGE